MATNNDIQIKVENEDYLPEYDDHVLFIHINQWENHSIAKIQLAAQQARDDLQDIFDRKRKEFTNLLDQINQETNTNVNENINISKWKQQLNKLQQDLSNLPSDIYLEHNKDEFPIHFIKLHHNINNNNEMKPIIEDPDEEIINVPGTAPLGLTMLHNLPLVEQKQVLGERLFVLVQQIEPTHTAKITGMFIELETKHILTLIKTQDILKEKIQEALDTLNAYQHKPSTTIKSS
ncbi:unnamed protein product [Rotaria sp. Silwood2]|nr:unnamed protein product [Rotaria sp. Silwood2]CAF2737671.1 unnamed protein product [Rotaria sp. Silwood2]CAF2990964.1 unnamed protein product [Rotaria sp. Silwood2]CAF3128560.1 unnamed protein product [Rotaria sp. Silwood2]CAF4095756.1 unnamed protein product [Rotaria sp. Silwood2]